MRRKTLYSRSSRSQLAGRPSPTNLSDLRVAPPPEGVGQPRDNPPAEAQGRHSPRSWLKIIRRYERPILLAGGGLFALLLVSLYAAMQPPPREITQRDIDAAVLHTLETKPLPSAAARAYEVIRPSVVRVRGLGHHDSNKDADTETAVGSGVVIVDKGIILTNVHVVAGARRVKVVFADGLDSDATVVALQTALQAGPFDRKETRQSPAVTVAAQHVWPEIPTITIVVASMMLMGIFTAGMLVAPALPRAKVVEVGEFEAAALV